jgi:hypothetical protein
MNCNCKGCNSNSMAMGAMVSGCNWWCRTGKNIRKAVNFVNNLGLLPPGVNVLVNAGTHAMGADNEPDPSIPTGEARQLNQRGLNSRMGNMYNQRKIGEMPKIF